MNSINSLLHLLNTIPPAYPVIVGLVLLILIASSTPTRKRFYHRRYPYPRNPRYTPTHQESPAEAAFRQAWQARRNNIHLESEYPVGRYRLDFAHVSSKTAIEIDGLIGHASPNDIAKDRSRQRYIEAQGWRFIRFGAKEVFRSPARCAKETEQFIKRAASSR